MDTTLCLAVTVSLFYIDLQWRGSKPLRLLLSRFANDPTHEYASIINDQQQLRVAHSHDYYELFMVNRGSAVHRVNGATQSIGKGTVVFIRPDDLHGYEHMSRDFEIINMLVPAPTMGDVFRYLGESFDSSRLTEPRLSVMCQLSPNDYAMIVVQLEQLVLSKHRLGPRSEALFRFTLMSVIFRCFPPDPENDKTDMPVWLRGLCLEMMKRQNFTEGMPALHRLANKSPEHLARTFRRYLRTSPTDFINNLRLEYAARTIGSTRTKIVDICGSAGFESLSHFYHLFRTKYGVAPTTFRKMAVDSIFPYSLAGDPVLESGIPHGIPFMK
jgi:AraC family transcriptional regulator, dual regulator of chb operon